MVNINKKAKEYRLLCSFAFLLCRAVWIELMGQIDLMGICDLTD